MKFISALLKTSAISLSMVSVAAHAQDVAAQVAKDAAVSDAEILVTARRVNERLQDVPVTVQAISVEALQKNAITDFTEISKIAPGLQLSFGTGLRGANAEVVLRGVRSSLASGAAAVPFYLNEMPIDPNVALSSLFDVGQIEVLRGPQGTSRGAPSIAGAVTISSRRPDTGELGGYVSALGGSGTHSNFQAALNVPIVRDVLAVRVAGLAEDSEGNRVRSLNNPADPLIRTRGVRVTAVLKPASNLTLQATYQYQNTNNRTYDQVRGAGSPGFTVAAAGANPARVLPANYNGPVIGVADELAVNDVRSDLTSNANIWIGSLKWNLGSHTIELLGSYQKTGFNGPQSQDAGNLLVGYDQVQGIDTKSTVKIGELRISSNPGKHLFDYVVGAYTAAGDARSQVFGNAAYLPGAFGAPGKTLSPFVTNPAVPDRYRLPLFVDVPLSSRNYSFYANLTAHLGPNTELSGGVRYIHDHNQSTTTITRQAGIGNFQSPVCPPGFSTSTVYGAGYCEGVLAPPALVGTTVNDRTFSPVIYSATISHKLSHDVLIFATTGSSYRAGSNNIAINLLSRNLLETNPENAKSYEVGVKSEWMDGKIRANLSVFQLDYDGQLTQFPGIFYRDASTGATTSLTSSAFYYNVDARVRGLESELAYAPSSNVSLAATASYAVIKSKGGLVPCNDPTRPLTATNEINLCPSVAGQVLNTAPKFSATISGEYRVPVARNEAFLRFNVAYSGRNPNYQFLSEAKPFALTDIFVGLRGEKSAWEVQAFAKNVFNVRTLLTETAIQLPGSGSLGATFGSPGYTSINSTKPRELGVQLRYSFGSR